MESSKTFIGFIAHKIVGFVTDKYPNYVTTHSTFTESGVEGELSEYVGALQLLLIPILVYLAIKLHERIRLYVKYKEYKGTARGVYEKPALFTKKAVIIFSSMFVLITSGMVATFIGGFKPQEFPDGFKMEYLQYQPDNQPITDEIVNYAADNIYPAMMEAGEMVLDVVTDPELAADMIQDMTGLNITEVVDKLEDKTH